MSIHQAFRTFTTITTVTTIAAVLGACDVEAERPQTTNDRGGDDAQTPAQMVAEYGIGIIDGVIGGHIEGFLGDFLDSILGGGDEFVTLSQESLDAIRDIVVEAIDEEAWEQEGLDLEAEIDFVDGYARSVCEGEQCDLFDEYRQDEENVERHSDEMHRFWVFFEDQGGIGKKASGAPQMMIIGSLRMMLLQEILELRHARGLNTDKARSNLRDAACDYEGTLSSIKADFDDDWLGAYTAVVEGDVEKECGGAWGYSQCHYEQEVCFDSPRGEYCDTQSRVEGSYIPPEYREWSNPDIVDDVKATQEQWMQEDFDTILGGAGFVTLQGKLESICSNPPTPS